jgi:hypothetical protein
MSLIPNNGRGRPKGAINRASRELKEFWHSFFTSEEYRERLKKRMLEGSAPHLESYLFNRIYGKPKEAMALDLRVGRLEDDLSHLSTEELVLHAMELVKGLRELEEEERELASAIPAQYRMEFVEAPTPCDVSPTNVLEFGPPQSEPAHKTQEKGDDWP